MGAPEILASIDREIARLQQARALLIGAGVSPARGTRGAAKKAAKAPPAAAKAGKKKRKLTPEGRKRIAEAVKRRWAAQRKAAAGK